MSSVNFMVKQTRTKWENGHETDPKIQETVYLTVGNTGNRVFTLHTSGQAATLTANHANHDVYGMTVADDSSVPAWTMVISGLQRGFFDSQGQEWHCEYTVEEVDAVFSDVTITDPDINTEIVTITNKRDETKAAVKVTKTFSGVDALPSNFRITATWEENGTNKQKILTLNDAQSGNGTAGNPYVWIINNIRPNTPVTFTEGNYTVENVNVTVQATGVTVDLTGPSATATAGDPAHDSTAVAGFVNIYGSSTGSLKILKTLTLSSGTLATQPEYSFTVSDGTNYYYLNGGTLTITTTAPENSESDGVVKVTAGDAAGITLTGLPTGQYTVTEVFIDQVMISGYIHTNTTMNGTAGTSATVTVVEDDPTDEDEETVVVEAVNSYQAGVELPTTGGPGTLSYTITGLVLIFLVEAFFLISRKRKEH